MSNPPSKSGMTTRTAMPAFGTFGTPQASATLLLEKSNPGLRRSTPDSEALASSDDELEQVKMTNSTATAKSARCGRRTSWLNDVTASNINRKPSITGPYSPSTSLPGTPGTEQMPWTSITAPGATAWSNTPTAYPWGTIWSQDNRKEPPLRLQEVLPSPGETGIPFSIPLQPTPKTYRSQSYSVGQLDTGSVIPPAAPVSTSTEATRSRLGGQFPSLQRRTSRTSGLGSLDTSGLGRLREVEDDEDDDDGGVAATAATAAVLSNGQGADALASSQARIEKLEKENAQLRQVAQSRDRAFSSTSGSTPLPGPAFRHSRFRTMVPEVAETAVDDREDLSTSMAGPFSTRDNAVRRLSDLYERQPSSQIDNRGVENVKKAHWQTSLGFGPVPEVPQSRRHSFADVPTRHGSFSSSERDEESNNNTTSSYGNGSQEISHGNDPAYFNNNESTRRAAEARVHQSYLGAPTYGHPFPGPYLGPPSQPLFIVNFKCCRSDVFYIQEGTGLHVNVGDLVIVEADRGTDLGTVQHTNVTPDEARKYKDYYAEEHYKWLMMFSLQSRNGGPNVVNPNGLPGRQGSAIGGMGPEGHHGARDSSHADLKPKMIKRLAQSHEIQALKDKEGNEARAKRVCQQKVLEHRLNMEILDAEFQMDSKKLTFYYFADSYINFNHLVTDLFKIYKTRIWMSAINPASFQTPTASLGLTPAYGASPAGTERDSPAGRRRHQLLGPQPAFGDPFDTGRPFHGQDPGLRSPFYNQYQDVGAGPQQLGAGVAALSPSAPGQIDPFASYYGGQQYQSLNPNAPNFATNRSDFRPRTSNQAVDANWAGRFQGLSLGS